MSDSIDPEVEPRGDRLPDSPDRSESIEPSVTAQVLSVEAGPDGASAAKPSPTAVRWYYRHRLPVRAAHWINVLCLPILVMSGFQIFNAHPALYLGSRSDRDHPILSMGAVRTESGEIRGMTTVLGRSFDTTGWLGASKIYNGRIGPRGFPTWATIPSYQWLAMGRRWHLFFAWIFVVNGLFFGLYALISRHFDRDLFPKG
jgi:thiosulfate reductase cytochrome b subunit